MKLILAFLLLIWSTAPLYAADTNWNCTNNPARAWWDVQHYVLNISVDTATGFIKGTITIKAKVIKTPLDSLQIDLQEPMQLNAVHFGNIKNKSAFQKNKNAYFISFPNKNKTLIGSEFEFTIQFEGIPRFAENAPWDGGMVFTKYSANNRWIAMACQGVGASVWLPCKDFPDDEPDFGMDIFLNVPKGLAGISNGKLISKTENEHKDIWHWQVKNPINNYNISFYIGNYTHWSDTFQGKKGVLNLDYFVLPQNLEKAKKQFAQVKTMLSCFEEKMGPYPFYEDGYKLIEAPYLGMEHQSAVAYGNQFENGYLGKDRSHSGVGLLFDFIIIHESAHEWFGNSITAKDKADMWIQEGFTTYAETIYAECIAGKDAAFKYQHGKKEIIQNDKPVQGQFGECDEGSGDHYDKAAYMIHSIRVLLNDDALFFEMLNAINETFYHKTVSGSEIEAFILNFVKHKNILNQAFFDQYLRKAPLPILEFRLNDVYKWEYRWTNCIPEFQMPVQILEDEKQEWILPATSTYKEISGDKNFNPKNINTQDFLFTIKVL